MDILLFSNKNALIELYYGKIKKEISNNNYSSMEEIILINNLTKLKKETYFNILKIVKNSFSRQINIYYSYVNESILAQITNVINKNISKVKVDTVEIKIEQGKKEVNENEVNEKEEENEKEDVKEVENKKEDIKDVETDDVTEESKGIKEAKTVKEVEKIDTRIWTTIMNGFRCFISGLYPETLRNSGVKHIYIDKKNISTLDKENIILEQNINSCLMSNDPYEGKWGVIGQIQVQSEELIFKMGDYIHQSNIRILNYNNYSYEILKSIQGNLNDVFIVLNITTPEDYKKFDEDIKNCFKSYIFRVGDVLYSIRDECKWREPNYCSFLDTTRVYLGESNELWDHPVCYLNDPIINKRREYQRENIKRKCKHCEKNSVCAKCMIIDDKHVNLYCNIKINNPHVISYLFYRNIIKSFIFSYIKQVELVKPDEIIYLIPQKDLTSFGFEFRNERFIYDNFRNVFYKIKI